MVLRLPVVQSESKESFQMIGDLTSGCSKAPRTIRVSHLEPFLNTTSLEHNL
jgi:hypothetical protein